MRSTIYLGNFCTSPNFSCVEFINFPRSSSHQSEKRIHEFNETISMAVAYEWSRSVYRRGRGGLERIPSIRISFKCLRASSRKIYSSCFDSKVRRCEGAKMQIVSSQKERETMAAAMIEGFIMRFICRENRSVEVCPRRYISGEPLRRSVN